MMMHTPYSALVFALCASLLALLSTGCDKQPVEAPEAEAPSAPTPEVTTQDEPGAAAPMVKEEAVKVAAVGKPAPVFSLTDQDGASHSLDAYKGKILVLEWTNPGCPYVKRHYDAKTMTATHEGVGEQVAWLAVDSSNFVKAEDAKKWRSEAGFDHPVLLDAEGAIGRAYGAKTTPHMYVIDAEGVLRYSGAIDDDPQGDKGEQAVNYVSSAVEALKAGKPVEQAETRPYGCSVKYGS